MSLRGARLGRRERELLLAAEQAALDLLVPPRDQPPWSAGMLAVTEPTRAGRVAAHRAARRLWELGLVERRAQQFGARRAYIALTPLGVEVVKRYRRELTEGQRIRWPREEN